MRARVFLCGFAALVCLIAFAPAAHAACPNEAIRAEQGAAVQALPGCMALEMVSPPQKNSQFVRWPNVSASGERVRFRSIAGLGGTPGLLTATGDHYVATRAASGWVTTYTVPPAGWVKGWNGAGGTPEAKSFSSDFSRWFNVAATTTQYGAGSSQAFLGGLGGFFEPLSPLMTSLDGGQLADVDAGEMEGASADLSHLLFRPGLRRTIESLTNAYYLSGDPRTAKSPPSFNVYVAKLDAAGLPSLELVARDGHGDVVGGSCGTRIGGTNVLGSSGEGAGGRDQGAVAVDGSQVFFSARPTQPQSGPCNLAANKLRIYKRLESPQGALIAPLYANECTRIAPACASIDGSDYYQGASFTQDKVYFTTNRQLANSDLDGSATECSRDAGVAGCDIYLYDANELPGHRLIQVSAGEDVAGQHQAGSGAGLYNGIAAISGDGTRAYFAAAGVLSGDPNPEGDTPEAGKPNLYLYQRDASHPDGHLAFVGTLDPGDGSGIMWGGAGTWRNGAYPVPIKGTDAEGREVGGDGHVLFFKSKAALTANDADGARRDVFRYEDDGGAASLLCVSCAPGGPDNKPFEVFFSVGLEGAAGAGFAEEGRWASEDGRTAVFRSAQELTPGPVEGATGLYLWRDGQLYRLPGEPYLTPPFADGRPEDGPTLSHDGSVVAFASLSQLLPQDGDTTPDVYVARTDGGFAPEPPPPSCIPDGDGGCQGAAPGSPSVSPPASAAFAGSGNATPQPAPRKCPKGKRRVRRGSKTRCMSGKHRRANADRRTAR